MLAAADTPKPTKTFKDDVPGFVHIEQTLQPYADLYNQAIPQKAVGHLTPVEALRHWSAKRPELFHQPVHHQAGPDGTQLEQDHA